MKYQKIQTKLIKQSNENDTHEGRTRVVIEWKKGKEGGGQEGGTGESDKGREIVYGPE